ncbi:hypothetical protein [Streptomyces litmocidini]|uniref:hypothetical protein n=1 Tax=Streptomyces litmocidini TaxID=67318 RepID=UPI003702425D
MSATNAAAGTAITLHDEADRVTSAADTWAFLARARTAGARVPGIAMPKGGHVMIRDARQWQRFTAEAAAALLGLAPFPEAPADSAEVFAGLAALETASDRRTRPQAAIAL